MSEELPSFEEASAVVQAFARRVDRHALPMERVDLDGARDRVLARAIVADRDLPPFTRSTRDGYACRAAEASAHGPLTVAGSTRAGQPPAGPLAPGSAWEIMTGAPVPPGANAVVMLEHVAREGDRIRLSAERTVSAGENLVAVGAEAHRGAELVSPGATVGPAQIALGAACGLTTLDVYLRPRVAILTTGDELVPVSEAPGPGQIRNSNAPMLAAQVAAGGGDPWLLPPVADTPEALDEALAAATGADLMLISGGVSRGTFDLVEPALGRLSARLHFTGVRIQPGRPLVFGELARAAGEGNSPAAGSLMFFGLPGNPISSAVTFLVFARPVLAALGGSTEAWPRFGMAQLGRGTDRPVAGRPGLTRLVPARCEYNSIDGAAPQVTARGAQGSGDLAAFARSNCFIVVPEDEPGLEAGAMVRILPL